MTVTVTQPENGKYVRRERKGCISRTGPPILMIIGERDDGWVEYVCVWSKVKKKGCDL